MTTDAEKPRRPSKWKWLPVGCLGTIVLAACILFFVASLAWRAARGSPPYVQAMSLAQQDGRVAEALGEPLEASAAVSGDIFETPEGERAELTFLVFGPEGRGNVTVIANKEGDRWVMEKAEVLVEATGERIDLLERPPAEELDDGG